MHTGLNCGETAYKPELGRDVCVGGFDSKSHLPLERGAALLCSRVSIKDFMNFAKALKNDRRNRDNLALLISSRAVSAARRLLVGYRVRLCASGRGPFIGGSVPSSGLVAVFVMLALCSSVDVYGFGSLRHDADGFSKDARRTEYHYFKGFGKREFGTPVHSWESEQYVFSDYASFLPIF